VDSFEQIAIDELHHTGCIQWAFDDLPDTYQFIQKGQNFIGFPALIDEGDAVGVRIFDTRAKAEQHHQAGLIRLCQLHMRKDCTYVLKNLPQSAAGELAYNRLPKHPLFDYGTTAFYKDDLLNVVLHHLFVEGRSIRSQQAFEQNLKQHKGELISKANEVAKIALDIMATYNAIKSQLNRLNGNDALAKDLNEQLDLLIYAGFISRTPFEHFKAIPRYLKAAQYRLDKYDNNAQKSQEIGRCCLRFWKEQEKRSTQAAVIPEQDPYRWMLEEYRVSLYAQQLRTLYPVSAKRLDKAWEERS
jgi:ATP-dependent helicase HrpA